jgi:hypothetical protein
MLTDHGAALLAQVITTFIAAFAVVLWWRKPWNYAVAMFALIAFLAFGASVVAVVAATA